MAAFHSPARSVVFLKPNCSLKPTLIAPRKIKGVTTGSLGLHRSPSSPHMADSSPVQTCFRVPGIKVEENYQAMMGWPAILR